MIFAYSVNCSCGQPLLTFAQEEAELPTQKACNETLKSLKEELEKSVAKGEMMRDCPHCKQRLAQLNLMAIETKFQTMEEADRELERHSQGCHRAPIH